MKMVKSPANVINIAGNNS